MLVPWDSPVKISVRFTMSGINPIITDHFEMFFRDMLGEACHEIKNGDGFRDQLPVFMAVVMKRNKFAVIGVNTWSSDNWSAKVTANVFDHLGRITFIGHGSDIKPIFVVGIDRSLKLFKGIADFGMQFVQKGGLKGVTQEFVVEVFLWRQRREFPTPPSETRQWIWGFHFRSLPKVWRTQINPGVKSSDLLSLWNIRETTLLTEEKRQFKRERSDKNKGRSSLAIVKTQWRCWTLMILKDIEVVLSMAYMLPQEGQKREWQRKGTNLKFRQEGQAYMAPLKEGSPQWIIFSTFSMTESRGCWI